jgi:opacity protein-like surface antigen
MSVRVRQGAQVACAILVCANLPVAAAEEHPGQEASTGTFSPESLFARGRYEAALSGGIMFSPFIADSNRPTLNYSVTGLQLGYMLSDVKGDGWWRGNYELAGEGFGSAVLHGPGGYIAGGTIWLRHNFVPRRAWALVPYFQAGAGAVSTDIERELVGEQFNFNLDLGLGVRYFVSSHWSVSLEYRYQHISNANLGRNNIGINAQGPILGVSCFF